MTPTPTSGSNGMPGRSCFRAAPAGSTWSRRDAKVWDALRFVFLMRASGPEHCRRVQIAVSKLPSSTGNRTSAFGVWSSNQGMDQLGEGASRRSLRSGYRSEERRGEIPEPAGCGNVGCWSPDPASWRRSVGLRYGQQGFRYRMTGSSGTAFTPTPISQVLLLGRPA